MKIVHIELGRFMYGGARQVKDLLHGLAERAGEHVLICERRSELGRSFDDPAIGLRGVGLSIFDEIDARACCRIYRILRDEKPDLVHVHSRRGNFPAVLAGRLAGIPCAMSHRIDSPLPCSVDIWVKFPLYRRIVANSDGIADALAGVGVPKTRRGEDFIVTVKSAVDTGRFTPHADREWFAKEFPLAGGGATIGVSAALIQRKGHRVLLDAMPAVLARHPRTQVLIFGTGRMMQELDRAILQRGLFENVRLAGYRTDLARILPNLDLLVHPALREGVGRAILEAASCGLPIVASRAGGIPEAVHDGVNGLLFDPGDSEALAAAINRLLDNPEERRGFGDAGRELALEKFTVERMVEDHLRIYRELLGHRPLRLGVRFHGR